MSRVRTRVMVGPIERGVPLPASKRGNGVLRKRMRELALGAVGDSFETGYSKTAVQKWAKELRITVETRKQLGGLIRVWRTV